MNNSKRRSVKKTVIRHGKRTVSKPALRRQALSGTRFRYRLRGNVRRSSKNSVRHTESIAFGDCFDNLPIGVYRTAPDGCVLEANQALAAMLGYSDRQSLLKVNILNHYVNPEDREFWRRRVEHDGVARNVQLRLKRRDGRSIWVRDTSRTVLDDHGHPLYYEGSVEEATGEHEAKERFRQIFARFRELEEIINRSPMVVVRWAADEGEPAHFVSGSVRRFGYAPEEFTSGKHDWWELVHPEDRGRVKNDLTENILAGEGEVTLTFRLITRAGECRWVEDRVYMPRREDGSLTHLEGIILDITRRRQLERELIDIASREQQRIGRDLHDVVGQNLTALGFMAGALAEELKKQAPGLKSKMEEIQSMIQQATAQTRMLSRGLCPVELETYGLRHGLQELAARTGELAGIDCSFICSEEFQQNSPDAAGHVYHICREAVNNALKHGPPETLTINLQREQGDLVLFVEDNGPGFCSDQDKRGALGLALMRYRAESAGGRLRIHSRPGEGTRVEFRVRD